MRGVKEDIGLMFSQWLVIIVGSWPMLRLGVHEIFGIGMEVQMMEEFFLPTSIFSQCRALVHYLHRGVPCLF